jgi:hypothetical protein
LQVAQEERHDGLGEPMISRKAGWLTILVVEERLPVSAFQTASSRRKRSSTVSAADAAPVCRTGTEAIASSPPGEG